MEKITNPDSGKLRRLGDNHAITKKAFTTLFDTYYVPLCNYIYSLTKDRQQAEDIVQDTMFIVWESRNNIQSNLSIKNYLYKIAYNKFIDTYRGNKVHLSYVDEVKKTALDYFIDKEEDYISNKNAVVFAEIQNLPPKCREAFLLSKKQGLKYKEVAEELNISVKTVEIHISKALKRIRDKVKGASFTILKVS